MASKTYEVSENPKSGPSEALFLPSTSRVGLRMRNIPQHANCRSKQRDRKATEELFESHIRPQHHLCKDVEHVWARVAP